MPSAPALRRVIDSRETLTQPEAAALMRQVLAGALSDADLAALLTALTARGETAAEIAGFALALRDAATPLPLSASERELVVDTCGTGGDASGTFNISTAAALVAAAAGASARGPRLMVAKHGNRAVTSQCGSADVLEALGIAVDLSPQAAAVSLRTHGFCFLLAPAHHPALKAVMPVRRALGVRTVFNILGPLLNPAGARRQVLGVYQPGLVPVVAAALALLGTEHALVVHGDAGGQGQDELALSGPSQLAEVRSRPTGAAVMESTIGPEQFGLQRAPLSALAGGDANANAAILTAIFAGETGPRRDVVLLNTAAVLVVAGLAPEIAAGIARAAQAIDTGAVTRLVAALQKG